MGEEPYSWAILVDERLANGRYWNILMCLPTGRAMQGYTGRLRKKDGRESIVEVSVRVVKEPGADARRLT